MKYFSLYSSVFLACFSILLLFGGCFTTPKGKLDHILKKHPELAVIDTSYSTIYDTIKSIGIDTKVSLNSDFRGLDSVLNLYGGKLDSISKIRINTSVKNYVINRPVINDTIIKIIDGITIKMFQAGKEIGLKIERPMQVTEKKVQSIINSVSVTSALTRWDKFRIWFFGNWWWIVGIILICWFLIKKFLV